MRRRIGIFAGTFNPVHEGHIAFALAAAGMCQLDEVIFLPEAEPRRKNNVANVDLRTQQLTQTLDGYPNLSVMVLDDKNFDIPKTLPKLRQLFPGADLTLLMGSDVALHLKNWDNIDQLLKTCELAIGLRFQHANMAIRRAMEKLQEEVGLPVQYELINAPHSDVASSQLK